MKRFAVLVLALCLLVTGCGNNGYSEAKKSSGFEPIKSSEMSSLPDSDQIETLARKAVTEIGAEKFESVYIGDYRSMIDYYDVSALGKTEDRWLLVSCFYSPNSSWKVTDIMDANTHQYYRRDGNEENMYPEDIVDYKTGEVIYKGLTAQERAAKAQAYLEENEGDSIRIDAEMRAKNYTLTTISEIKVNDDASDPDHYIVIVRLDTKLKDNDLVVKYSDDMSAYLYEKHDDAINEVAVFWEAPSGSLKRSYERSNNGMVLMDQAGF